MKTFDKILMAILLTASFVSYSNGQTPSSNEQASIKEDGLLYKVEIGNKCGLIAKTGEYVVNPKFDKIDNFSEYLAWVNVGGKWGLIDKTGKFVVNPQFDDVDGFTEGLAIIKMGGKYGIIDKTGKYVVDPQFDGIELRWCLF